MRSVGRLTVAILSVVMAAATTGCDEQQHSSPSSGADGSPAAATLDVGFDAPPAGMDPNSPKVVAQNIAFERLELHGPPATPFILVFENRDTAPHNISIYRLTDPAHEEPLFRGKVVDQGPVWYPVPGLAAGQYEFICDIHPIPAMTGRINVL